MTQSRSDHSKIGIPDGDFWARATYGAALPRYDPSVWATLLPNSDPRALDLLSQMLCYSPSDRISAAEASHHEYFRSQE